MNVFISCCLVCLLPWGSEGFSFFTNLVVCLRQPFCLCNTRWSELNELLVQIPKVLWINYRTAFSKKLRSSHRGEQRTWQKRIQIDEARVRFCPLIHRRREEKHRFMNLLAKHGKRFECVSSALDRKGTKRWTFDIHILNFNRKPGADPNK